MIVRKKRATPFVHRLFARKCPLRECCRAKSRALVLLFTLSILSFFGRLQLSFLRAGSLYSKSWQAADSNSSEPATFTGDAIRCKVKYLGCVAKTEEFSLSQNQVVMESSNMTGTACFHFCLRRSYQLIVLQGSTCACAVGFGSLSPIDVIKEGCAAPCPGGGGITCGGSGGVSVYMGFEPCQVTNVSASQIATSGSYLGCFEDNQFTTMSFRLVSSPSECILHCEFQQFPLALMFDSATCHCARFNSKFSINASGPPSACNRTCVNHVTQPRDGIGCGGPGHVSVWRTMAEERCGEKTYLEPGSVPLTALVSMPGSGNTWLRYMLETASGIFTGSVYSDKAAASGGLFGEMDLVSMRRTLTVKDHIYLKTFTAYPQAYDRVVLLVRNPFDALIAEFNRRNTKQHVGLADAAKFQTNAWHNYVVATKVEWQLIHEHILRGSLPVLVVFYDHLLADKDTQLRRILDFAKFHPADLEKRLSCLERNEVEHFKRKKRENFNPYTRALVEELNDSIASLRRVMADFCLGEVPPWERPVDSLL